MVIILVTVVAAQIGLEFGKTLSGFYWVILVDIPDFDIGNFRQTFHFIKTPMLSSIELLLLAWIDVRKKRIEPLELMD